MLGIFGFLLMRFCKFRLCWFVCIKWVYCDVIGDIESYVFFLMFKSVVEFDFIIRGLEILIIGFFVEVLILYLGLCGFWFVFCLKVFELLSFNVCEMLIDIVSGVCCFDFVNVLFD